MAEGPTQDPKRLPTAWRAGDVGIYTDEAGSAAKVKLLENGFRILAGRRAWYAQTISGSFEGGFVFEDTLQTLSGAPKEDTRFAAWMNTVLQPGIFQTNPKPGKLINVRDLSNFTSEQLEYFDAELNPGWCVLESRPQSFDQWDN